MRRWSTGLAGWVRRRRLWWAAGLTVTMLCLPMPAWAEPSPSPSPGSGPITVHPSWENAPWQGKVQTILNVTAQGALACCVLSFLLGAAAMGVGRITGSYQAGNRGVQLLVGGGGGALVVATAASAVRWLVG